MNKRGAGLKKALAYFQQALQQDPAFALAYSGIADAFSILGFYGAIPPHDAMPKARQYAEKAIQLNASNVEAYTTLAFISVFMTGTGRKQKNNFSMSLRSIQTMHLLIVGIAIIYRSWKANTKRALKRQERQPKYWNHWNQYPIMYYP